MILVKPKMWVVKTKLVHLFGACAVTVWPFCLISPEVANNFWVLQHEAAHYRQQRKWAIYGLGVGLLAWFALYLLVLPVGWNPFRRKWETEAFKAEGISDKVIDETLKGVPYYLWW